MNGYDLVVALCMGVGLAAACGFRVFVPLLVMSVAAKAGHLTLAQNMQWLGSDVAIAGLAVAAGLEVLAYYVPWVDNLLDTVATPAAVVAGTLATAAAVTGMDPMLQWSIAAIAGGGAAAVVQGVTVVSRAASSVATAGLGNGIVSTTELTAASLLALIAIILPVVAAVLFVALAVLLVRRLRRRSAAPATAPAIPQI